MRLSNLAVSVNQVALVRRTPYWSLQPDCASAEHKIRIPLYMQLLKSDYSTTAYSFTKQQNLLLPALLERSPHLSRIHLKMCFGSSGDGTVIVRKRHNAPRRHSTYTSEPKRATYRKVETRTYRTSHTPSYPNHYRQSSDGRRSTSRVVTER